MNINFNENEEEIIVNEISVRRIFNQIDPDNVIIK